jgi:hypothetical protein
VTNTSTGATQQHDPPAGFDMFFWVRVAFPPTAGTSLLC